MDRYALLVDSVSNTEAIALQENLPFWQNGWFIAIIVLVVLALVGYVLWRLRAEHSQLDLDAQIVFRTIELVSLNEILVAISQSLDLQETLDEALDRTLQLLDVESGGIYLLDEYTNELVVAAHYGFQPGFIEQIDRLQIGEGFSGQVMISAEPLVIQDITQDPRLSRNAVIDEGLHSLAVVPLVSGRETLGTLFVVTHGPRQFSDQNIKFLTAIGAQIGVAVENARLYEQTSSRLAQLTALQETNQALVSTLDLDTLLDRIINQVVTLLQADGGILNLVDWDKEEDEVVACIGKTANLLGLRGSLHSSLSGWVTLNNQPVISNTVREDPRVDRREHGEYTIESLTNAALAPLYIKGKVIGTLVVIDKLGGTGKFNPPDLDLLVAFANQAATAIENARLFEAEQQRAEQFRVIAEVGRRLALVLDEDEVIRQVVQVIQHAFGYYHVGIGLVEDDDVVFRIGAGQLWENREFQYKPAHLKIGQEGITGWVAAHGESLLVADITQEPRYVYMKGSATRSELTVPIKVKNEVIGVLDVQSDSVNAFDETDLKVLESLAHQAGAAIENARLYEQSQQTAVIAERSRLARELHDAVTQTLFSASLLAEALPVTWMNDQVEGEQLVFELRQLSRGALAEMRTLLMELRPSALAEARLEDLLRQLGETVTSRQGIPVSINTEGLCVIPPDVHIAFYRIAQEALNNVAKHSQASQVDIILQRICPPISGDGGESREFISLSIRDDGRGFDLLKIPPDHLGIRFMQERAEAVNAEMTIDSLPGSGAVITVMWEFEE